jgi:hypothetical protein
MCEIFYKFVQIKPTQIVKIFVGLKKWLKIFVKVDLP